MLFCGFAEVENYLCIKLLVLFSCLNIIKNLYVCVYIFTKEEIRNEMENLFETVL